MINPRGVKSTNPSVECHLGSVCARVIATLLVCRQFGAKVLSLKILMKAVPGLFEHSDKNVRAEVSVLLIIFRHHISGVPGIVEVGLSWIARVLLSFSDVI